MGSGPSPLCDLRSGDGAAAAWPVLRARSALGVQRVRAHLRPKTWWDHTSETRTFRGTDIVLRPPRLVDAAAWSQARRSNRERLETAFPAWGEDWTAEQGELAWTERCVGLRRAARAGRAYPGVIVAPNHPDGPQLYGETGIDSIDLRTGTGEMSGWTSASIPSGRIVRWAGAYIVLRAFTAPEPLLRVVAPFAVTNRGPESTLRAIGFERELTLSNYREYGPGRSDHHLYVIHNTESTRIALRQLCNR